MYTQTSIDLLIGRIRWDAAIPPTSIVVDADNSESTSGRRFNSFHQLVTVENVNDSVNNLKIGADDLNAYLLKMKEDSVKDVLNRLFDLNMKAKYKQTEDFVSLNYSLDGYDVLIADNASVFDNAIGYAMAVRAIQLFITSERSNATQRRMKQSYDYLKSELEGFKAPDGMVVVKGVNALFTEAVADADKVLFPVKTLSKKYLNALSSW